MVRAAGSHISAAGISPVFHGLAAPGLALFVRLDTETGNCNGDSPMVSKVSTFLLAGAFATALAGGSALAQSAQSAPETPSSAAPQAAPGKHLGAGKHMPAEKKAAHKSHKKSARVAKRHGAAKDQPKAPAAVDEKKL
jgi:hypothetical protein